MAGESGLKRKIDIDEEPSSKMKKSYKPKEVQQLNEELLRRLSEVELKVVQSNDLILQRIEDLKSKIQSNSMESHLKNVEEMIKTNEKLMERLQNFERKVDKMLAVNEGTMKDGVESLSDETDKCVASPTDEWRFEVFDNEFELKDEVWEKVVEVTAAIEAETGMEEENFETIDIDDDVTPDMSLKREKKPAALLQSPWVNEYDSTSGTKKRIVKCTFAF